MIGSILTTLTAISTGYALVKDILADSDEVKANLRRKKKPERKAMVREQLKKQIQYEAEDSLVEKIRRQERSNARKYYQRLLKYHGLDVDKLRRERIANYKARKTPKEGSDGRS